MTWRFTFSTLGCPGATTAEVIELAHANACEGVEVRVHKDEFLRLDLGASRTREVGERFTDAGLQISALAGYARVCAPAKDRDVIEEMRTLIMLAEQTSAQAVRVFPGGDADSTSSEHQQRALRRISAVLPSAREAGVQLLVETHDSHPTGRSALGLVEALDDPQHAAVLWDGLHPWRHGESAVETRRILGQHCAYFQVKDALPQEEKWIPVIPGEGHVPLQEQGRSLQDFTGWVSLEWERAWHPQIEALEEALPAAGQWFHRWRPAD
ncbi:sugar phosphate isomerase/epimerase family protein [Nesterenkonia sp. CF4.4]|uniref:sugar phosphate isomerase/epimerase family protein n=1 Tax=Nesterenkonia sp. CF4.4 TaxID=3373079 RepID=UPI003EE78EF3